MGLSAISGALLMAAAPPQEFNIAGKADLCATDPAATVRPDSGGVTANYVFRLESTLTPPVSASFDGLDRARFAVGIGVQTQRFSLVFVQTRIPARDAEQVRADVKILCGFSKVAPGKMALFERIDAKARVAQAREAERQVALRKKEAREAAERNTVFEKMFDEMKARIDIGEVEAVLRSDPLIKRDFFDQTDPAFKMGQIREMRCNYDKRGAAYFCRIGLPVYLRGAPEYLEMEAKFRRGADGHLHYDDQSDTIIMN